MTRGAQAGTAGQTRIISIDGALPDGQCEPGYADTVVKKGPPPWGEKSGINAFFRALVNQTGGEDVATGKTAPPHFCAISVCKTAGRERK